MPRAISNQGGSNLPEDLLPLGLVLRVGEQAVVVQVFKAKQAGLQGVGGRGGWGWRWRLRYSGLRRLGYLAYAYK